MQEPDAILDFIDRISRVGFGPLVALILFGNFMGIWVWGKFHREDIQELREHIVKLEAEKNQWKDMALGLLTPLESTLRTTKKG